jgi:hypothetical protein
VLEATDLGSGRVLGDFVVSEAVPAAVTFRWQLNGCFSALLLPSLFGVYYFLVSIILSLAIARMLARSTFWVTEQSG